MAISYNKIILIFFFLSVSYSQNQNIKFDHLTTEHGLASESVQGILQDSQGFMWFATRDGLHRYDGYKFNIYRPEPGNPHSISSVFCTALYEHPDGSIWIGTYGGGLNRLDPGTEKFTRFVHDPSDSLSISNNYIMSITSSKMDKHQSIWLGTYMGLSELDLNSSTFKYHFIDINRLNDPEYRAWTQCYSDRTGNIWVGATGGLWTYDWEQRQFLRQFKIFAIKTMFEDRKGNFWVGSSAANGLYKIDRKNKTYKHFVNEKNDEQSLSSAFVSGIAEDENGQMWIGTYDGLNLMNDDENAFTRFMYAVEDPNSLSHNFIQYVYESPGGPIWISTLYGGVNKLTFSSNRFKHYKLKSPVKKQSGFHCINYIYEQKTVQGKILWLATNGGGLFRFNPLSNQIESYYDKKQSRLWFVRYICPDPIDDKKLWVATWGAGLHLFDTEQITFKDQFSGSAPPFIYSIILSKNGKLLVGTAKGLFVLNPKNHTLRHIKDPSIGKNDEFVKVICEIEPGHLWLGTYGLGLKEVFFPIYDTDSSEITFNYYIHNETDSLSLSSNTIHVIHYDQRGNLWIGTMGGGLNLFNPEDSSFTHFTKKDGLPSNVINSILEDEKGHLWLSTNNGISKFDPLSLIFKHYDTKDGLQGNEFFPGSTFQATNGNMYFGGTNGFNVFHPDSIKNNGHIPPVVLTDFQIFNKSVKPGPQAPIKRPISMIDEIILQYDQNVFSFEFAALDYSSPSKNKYVYKMEGVDPDWVHTDASRRFATYTNLDPGEYTFWIKGSNNDGIWNETGKSVKVIILPPWWRTTWAFISYLILILILLYSLRRYDLKRQRLKHELELEHVHAEKLQELDRLKSQFFANISHEFRTPLTLILGPIENMLARVRDRKSQNELSLMKRNAKRLHRLINQLLDLSKLEAGAMKLHASQVNIIHLVKSYVQSFESLARRKKINLQFKAKEDEIVTFVDKNKIEDVLNNLLSNAFKFTPEGGVVEVMIAIEPSPNPCPVDRLASREGDKIDPPPWRGFRGG